MGNNNLKRTIISMSILVIVIAMSYLFIRFLPYILLVVLIAYIAYKITRFFSNTNRRTDDFYDNHQTQNQPFNSSDTEENEFDTDKAIDIEYKEVDKDKK